MNKTILFLIGLGAIAIVIYGLFSVKNKPVETILTQAQVPTVTNTPKNVDYSAGFTIYTNGTFRIFTAVMYHNLSEDVFIQAGNPNIVHVKKVGTTWNDFFKTLPFKLTKDCLITGTKQTFCTNENGALKFYLNGKREDDLLSKEIQDRDRALITYGNEDEEQIKNQLQQVPIP